MSYSEKDGQVTLTMSREDYAKLLMELGGAMPTDQLSLWRRLCGKTMT